MTSSKSSPLDPTATTIGILGGGQLGRMTILAGRNLGFRFKIFDPSPVACAAAVADEAIHAPWEDTAALEQFLDGVDLVTFEFENVSTACAAWLAERVPVYPAPSVLATCQNRQREKTFCRDNDLPCAPFAVAENAEELAAGLAQIGYPCVLKTATSGYDGKGQQKLTETPADIPALWEQMGGGTLVIEKWITFAGEYSVICARGQDGQMRTFPVPHNVHRNHILHTSTLPSGLSAEQEAQAAAIARQAAAAMGVVGLLTTELFLTEDGRWLVNEFAPRPHNSGHWTMEACVTSQFEQLVRSVAGLPLGDTSLRAPVTMLNLLGDLWQNGTPDWSRLLKESDVHLHLYDKGEPRPARKMGHVNIIGEASHQRAETVFA